VYIVSLRCELEPTKIDFFVKPYFDLRRCCAAPPILSALQNDQVLLAHSERGQESP